MSFLTAGKLGHTDVVPFAEMPEGHVDFPYCSAILIRCENCNVILNVVRRSVFRPKCMNESSSERDARLVRETLRGNDNAYRQLMDKYVKIAGYIAYSVAGDFHIAADIVQEAFMKVYRLLPGLQNPATFRSYLADTVRSTSLDWLRRQRALRRGSPITFSELADDSEPSLEGLPDQTPLDRMERSENYEELLKLINTLPETYREVFVLKHIEHISYDEIADILGITMSSVEARLFRARKMLRDRLTERE